MTDTTTTRPLTEATIRTIVARHRSKVPWELQPQNRNGLTPYAVYLPTVILYSPADGRPVGDLTSAEAIPPNPLCRTPERPNACTR